VINLRRSSTFRKSMACPLMSILRRGADRFIRRGRRAFLTIIRITP
jgi:hypothetical protein